MARDDDQKNRTRGGMKRPKVPKKWFARTLRREHAKVLARMFETIAVLEIREQLRDTKRDRPRRARFKRLREERAAVEAHSQFYHARAKAMKRDAKGRWLAGLSAKAAPTATPPAQSKTGNRTGSQ